MTDREALLDGAQIVVDYLDGLNDPTAMSMSSILQHGIREARAEPTLDEGLREAAQALVTWWDTPPYVTDNDHDLERYVNALRKALALAAQERETTNG